MTGPAGRRASRAGPSLRATGARPALGALLLALGAALAGCAAPAAAPDPPAGAGPRDLVTHVADDGSLVAGLADADPTRRWLAARGLARLPAPPSAAPVVGALATETDARVLAELCFALGRWGEASAREPLRRAASFPDESVRAAALEALSRLLDDRLTSDLVAGLADDRPLVRGAAALALARLDGRRGDHARVASEDQLAARDEALARAASDDPDPGVRWRAAYALASVRPRAAHGPALVACLGDPTEPLATAFALRGLLTLQREGLADALGPARTWLFDPEPLLATEAGRCVAALGDYVEVLTLATGHPLPGVRVLAWEGLAEARARSRQASTEPTAAPGLRVAIAERDGRLLALIEAEPSPWVRRAGRVAAARLLPALEAALGAEWRETLGELLEIERGRSDFTGRALALLASSGDRRDREAAATLLADGTLRDDERLSTLLDDLEPAVRAAALPALSDARLSSLWPRLREALDGPDVAALGAAATACAPIVASGRAPPWLMTSLAQALARAETDFTLEEARIELAAALGLPPLDPVAPPTLPAGTLLDLLAAEHAAALADPAPRVRLVSDRGALLIELDRPAAPRHVANFLELAAAGFYDGLSLHRVVPGFVVQGLDPRGDGWGTGGRRVPDEFSRAPYLAGTLGMPRTGRPHTGGCQVFFTHLPTPHLEGQYTVFGRIVDGLDLLPRVEVGDAVASVRRVDG